MKTSFSLLILITTISPVALLQTGCSKNETSARQIEPSANANGADVAVNVNAPVSDSWDGVKDYTYEKRGEFTAAFDRMTAKMADKTREIKAKGGSLSDDGAKDRDHAMNDLAEARSELTSRLTDLNNATADTWADAKGKVGQAWQKV
jgi:hypothetical protein